MRVTGLVGLVCLAGCSTAPQPPAFRVEPRTLERHEPGVDIVYRYPEVVAGAAQDAINTRIRKEMLFQDEKPSLEAIADGLSADYKKFKAEFPKSAIEYSDERTGELLNLTAKVAAFAFSQDSFLGGAHPNSLKNFVNFNPSTGETIPLSAVVKEGAMPKLNEIAEKKLRESRKIAPGTPLKQAGFFKDEFKLNENFSIGAVGLTFYFNDYEIAPHSTGPSEILLPYADIKELLKIETGLLPIS